MEVSSKAAGVSGPARIWILLQLPRHGLLQKQACQPSPLKAGTFIRPLTGARHPGCSLLQTDLTTDPASLMVEATRNLGSKVWGDQECEAQARKSLQASRGSAELSKKGRLH